MAKNQGTKQREQRSLGDCWQWKADGQSSKGDDCSFLHDMNKRAKPTQPNPSPRSSTRQNVKNASRTRSPGGRSPSGRMSRLPCKGYLKGTCTNSFCEKWHPPECLFYKSKNEFRFGEKCSYAHRQVDEQPSKRSTKNGGKSTVAMLKDTRQLGCIFQVMEPPKSILRKSTNMQKPIQRVKFTKAIARHAKIRDQNPSLGYICLGDPHQRNPNAPKFEDRSQEETAWQERCAREAAWKLAKHIQQLKEKDKTAFFSPSKNRCLPAPSTRKPEEREFVVDSGASMHMISKKDLSDAEMDTLTKSCSPTIVITANGEVQTHEEAIVYVKELDTFLTLKVLEDTTAFLSLGKLCDEHGYSYEWINGQKPHLIKNGIRIPCNTENFVPIVVPGLSASSSSSLLSSTSMTPSRQEIDHPTSSSSSSTSPTITVSSDSETRARRDLCGIDSYPAAVSSKHVERQERGHLCSSGAPEEELLPKPTKNPKTKKNEDHDQERGDLCHSDIPEWLQEFRENLVDDRVPERRDSHASSSQELKLEPRPARSADLGKHSVKTHFTEDRNCEICQRTKITRAPCRRRIGGAVPRAEIFGELVIADHKVLSEGCESRNNHRYAVVVQDLATQWIQSYPCKTKTSQET